MSQAGGQPIGSARIDFVGNTEQLKQAAQEAKSVTENAVAGDSGSGIKSARRDIGQILGAAGAIGAVIASLDRLLVGIGEFNMASATLADNMRAVSEGLSFDLNVGGIEGQLNNIRDMATKRIADIATEAEKQGYSVVGLIQQAAEAATGGDIVGEQIKKINAAVEGARRTAELRIADRDAEEARKLKERTEREEKAAQESYAARIRSIETQVRSQVAATLEGEQRIRYETETSILAVDDMRRKAHGDELARLDQLEKAIRAASDQRLQEFRRAEDDKRKEAEKTANSMRKAMLSAFADIRSQANSAFNPNSIESGIGSILQKIDLIAQQLQRIQ